MIMATQGLPTSSREVRISIGNDSAEIDSVRCRLLDVAREFNACDESDIFRIGMVLEESLRNAFIHGNLEVESQADSDTMSKLIEMRRRTPPYCDRTIEVRAHFNAARAVFQVTDCGPGFDRSKLKDPTAPENLDKEFGRGLTLIEHFADGVEFTRKGNSVKLTVYYSS